MTVSIRAIMRSVRTREEWKLAYSKWRAEVREEGGPADGDDPLLRHYRVEPPAVVWLNFGNRLGDHFYPKMIWGKTHGFRGAAYTKAAEFFKFDA